MGHRNCWTCEHNELGATQGYTCESDASAVVSWQNRTPLDGEFMPARDTPDCPGWVEFNDGSTVNEVDPEPFKIDRDEWKNLLDRVAELERGADRGATWYGSDDPR